MSREGEIRRAAVVEEQEALHEVAHELASARDLGEILRRIAHLALAAGDASTTYLERIDHPQNEVEIVATAGSAPPVVGTRVPYPGSLAEEVVQQGEPEILSQATLATRPIAGILSSDCLASEALVVPLISERGAVGVLILLRCAGSPSFTSEEVGRLQVFGDLAALALQRVLLQEELKRRMLQLEESERRFRLLAAGVREYAIFMLDPEGRIVSWNLGAERIKGYSAEEIIGEHFSRFYSDEDRAIDHPAGELRIASETGSYEEEGWRIRKDGSRFFARVTITAIREQDGELIGFSKVTQDLTERRRHEQEREEILDREREAHRRVARVLERITDAFFALDTGWRFTYLNHSAQAMVETLLKRPAEEVVGMSLWDVVPQFSGTSFEEQYRRAMREQEPMHFTEFSEHFGVWFDVHAYPSPQGLSVYFRDITEQKQAEESLEIERRRLRAVLDALPVGVFISDGGGRLLEANLAAQTIWGGPTPLSERPEDYGAYRGRWPESGEPLTPEDWALARAIRHGEVVAGEEVEIQTFDGAIKSVLTYGLPIRDSGGEVFGGVAVLVDVTERTRLLQEARAARAAAEKANRAKSEFLATMSHEIRTPINAIIGYTELLEMGIAGPVTDTQRSQLERVRSSSSHLLSLINDVLDLAKVEAGRMKVVRDRAIVQHVVSTAVALVTPQAAERDLRLDMRCSGSQQQVVYCGDEDRVRQILVNILSNAVKFTEPGGSVTIECGRTDHPDPASCVGGNGPWVFVSVRDTGIGIPAEEMEQVFQPFVQADSGPTRKWGGTGLGLTISRELARLMEGDLTARSEAGAGSEFTLWLREPRDSARSDRDDAPGLVPGGEALVCVGRAVLKEVDEIMTTFTARLWEDETFGDSRELGDADLRDHGVAFLTDIAQSLVAVEQSEVDPVALLRDGGEIQRVISELHGAQRGRLGWGSAQVKREFDILREEVELSVRRQAPQLSAEDLQNGLAVLLRCLDLAEEISVRALDRDRE